MKVSITVVATKTFTAGLVPSADVAMLQAIFTKTLFNRLEDSTGRGSQDLRKSLVRNDSITSLSARQSTCWSWHQADREAGFRRRAFRRGTCGDRTSDLTLSGRV